MTKPDGLTYVERRAKTFWAGVDKSASCWLWLRSTDHGGYGRTKWRDIGTGAHRLAYLLTHGEIPDGLEIDHHYAPLTRYSRICPGCQARYGEGQASGMIDVQRCAACTIGLTELHCRTEALQNRSPGMRQAAKPKLHPADRRQD